MFEVRWREVEMCLVDLRNCRCYITYLSYVQVKVEREGGEGKVGMLVYCRYFALCVAMEEGDWIGGLDWALVMYWRGCGVFATLLLTKQLI